VLKFLHDMATASSPEQSKPGQGESTGASDVEQSRQEAVGPRPVEGKTSKRARSSKKPRGSRERGKALKLGSQEAQAELESVKQRAVERQKPSRESELNDQIALFDQTIVEVENELAQAKKGSKEYRDLESDLEIRKLSRSQLAQELAGLTAPEAPVEVEPKPQPEPELQAPTTISEPAQEPEPVQEVAPTPVAAEPEGEHKTVSIERPAFQESERERAIQPSALVVIRRGKEIEVVEVPLSKFHPARRPHPDALSTDEQRIFTEHYKSLFTRLRKPEAKRAVLKEFGRMMELISKTVLKRPERPLQMPEDLRIFSPETLAPAPTVAVSFDNVDVLESEDVTLEFDLDSEASYENLSVPDLEELVVLEPANTFDDHVRAPEAAKEVLHQMVERGQYIAEVQKAEGLSKAEAATQAQDLEKSLNEAISEAEKLARKAKGPEKDLKLGARVTPSEIWEKMKADFALQAKDLSQGSAGDSRLKKLATAGLAAATAARIGVSNLLGGFKQRAAESVALFGAKKEAKKEKDPSEQKVPSSFAAAVEKARASITPGEQARKFARERIAGLMTLSYSEWRNAEQVRYYTAQVAKKFSHEFEGGHLGLARKYRDNELFRKDLVDSAIGHLEENLGSVKFLKRVKTYRGELIADVIKAKSQEIRTLLSKELEDAANGQREVDAKALQKKLRDAIDPEYWKRYVWGSVELVAAASGVGYFMQLKSAGAAAKGVGAKIAGKEVARRAVTRSTAEAVSQIANAATEATGFTGPDTPEALSDAREISHSIWNTVKQFYLDRGVNPTNRQILAASKEIAQANDVSVPEWNIKGSVSARRLARGVVLRGFTKLARELSNL
jgi:hypothetical protein